MNEQDFDPIAIALDEDIGRGDVTSEFFVPQDRQVDAHIVAREPTVLAGIETAAEVFRRVDPTLRVDILKQDGAEIAADETVLQVRGSARSILTAERVALNFIQRLCGIATLTRQFVNAVGEHRAKILDTRKTTPGLRALEKAAVVAGGGMNHRFSLNDMALIKDNHLSAGEHVDLASAIQRLRKTHPNIRIEIEADRLEQVRAFLKVDGIDVILLDNMTPEQLREAVALGNGKVKFEASGRVTLQNVSEVAATGVDYISVGAVTHSARAIDFSLELAHGAA